jgi:hypothetical protein
MSTVTHVASWAWLFVRVRKRACPFERCTTSHSWDHAFHLLAFLEDQFLHLKPFLKQAIPFFLAIFRGGARRSAVLVSCETIDVVDGPIIFIEFAEETVRPLQIVAGRAARNDEQLYAKSAHKRRLAAELGAVILRGEVTPPILVADTPIGDIEVFRVAICSTLLRPGGSVRARIWEVTVLDPIAQLAWSS